MHSGDKAHTTVVVVVYRSSGRRAAHASIATFRSSCSYVHIITSLIPEKFRSHPSLSFPTFHISLNPRINVSYLNTVAFLLHCQGVQSEIYVILVEPALKTLSFVLCCIQTILNINQ
jgi:hypothetical protein